jgi:selenocysteine-specific elongation factor
VRVRGIESLGRPATSVHGVARVALELGGKAPEELGRGSVLVTPGAFEPADVVDVRLSVGGRLPERPMLHVGAASMTVHARPLSDDLVRLTLDAPLPLRIGDRALLRDPGSRELWGVQVLDPAPPPLRRRGAAALRAKELAAADGTTGGEIGRRGVVRRSLLLRLGATGDVPADAVAVGDWLVSGERAAGLRRDLAAFVASTGTPQRPGVPVAQVAHALGLPDERLVAALVPKPLRVADGLVWPQSAQLPPQVRDALAAVRQDLSADPFAAPDADRLRALGLTTADLAGLARAGHLLRVADGVVLLPGADTEALRRLEALPQPFTVSQARAALGSTRRVVLPLLAHLDRTARTVRLPDDRRRVR